MKNRPAEDTKDPEGPPKGCASGWAHPTSFCILHCIAHHDRRYARDPRGVWSHSSGRHGMLIYTCNHSTLKKQRHDSSPWDCSSDYKLQQVCCTNLSARRLQFCVSCAWRCQLSWHVGASWAKNSTRSCSQRFLGRA